MTMMEIMIELMRPYPKVEWEGQKAYNPYPEHWVLGGLECMHNLEQVVYE